MTKPEAIRLVGNSTLGGHPWRTAEALDLPPEAAYPDGEACSLYTAAGECLGSGIFDRRDPAAAWRRFSFAEGAAFDESYLVGAIHGALERRGAEPCQRLISSDADYLPGLVVEQYDQILTIRAENAAVDQQLDLIADILKEACSPQEIVFLNDATGRKSFGLECGIRTLSGNNLKGRWVEIDGVSYRLDFMQPEKPGVFLDQREQHVLLGSLCEGRCVLDAHAHAGGFALHALKNGAEHAVALDLSEVCVKAIGANAQRNGCPVEAIDCDAAAFLAERTVGDFDCIVLDPPQVGEGDWADLQQLHASAFRCLPSGGILATYCRSGEIGLDRFESMVAAAAAQAGREGRIFARTGQPFDFPALLGFPESSALKGLILQVE